MTIKWVEIKNGDALYFKGKTGSGSVVKTENHGRYFMPAKIGMRIKGEIKPIEEHERFILQSSKVQMVDGPSRIIKCFLVRISDNTVVAISEQQMMQYFYKRDESSLSGYDY